MSQIIGTNVSKGVVPYDTADAFETHDEQYGKGGYRTVSDLASRDAITAARRSVGMRVKVLGDDGTGVSGRDFSLSADLINWISLPTPTEIARAIAAKVDMVPPLKPSTYINAVRNRFNPTSFAGATVAGSVGSAPLLSVVFEQAAYDNFEQPAVIRMADTVAGALTQPRFTIPVTIADLALVNLVPSDSAPQSFSARAAIQRGSLLNQTIDASTSTNGIWYVILRYNGIGASLTGPFNPATDVGFSGNQLTPISIGLGQTDPLWVGSTGSVVLTSDEKILIRNNIPLRATYNGKAFSGIIKMFFGQAPAAGPTAFSVGRIALIAGASIDPNTKYLNIPEDKPSYVGQESLSPQLADKIAKAVPQTVVDAGLANTLTKSQAPTKRRPVNRLPLDVDYAASLDMRTPGYAIVDLVAQTDLVERGYTKALQWTIASNNYARWQSGVSQQNKYVFGCMLLYSTDATNIPDVTALNGSTAAALFSSDTGGTLTAITLSASGGIKLSDRCVLLWAMGQCLAANPNLLVGRPFPPAIPATLFVTGFNIFTSDTAFEIDGDSLATATLMQDIVRKETMTRVDKKIAAGLSSINTTNYTSYPNAMAYGDYVGGTPNLRSASTTIALASINPLYKLGFRKGFNAKGTSGQNQYFRYTAGVDISNKYFVGIFLVQSDAVGSVPVATQQFTENMSAALTALTTTRGNIDLGNGTFLQWVTGHTGTLTNTQNYLFGINGLPAGDTYVTGAYAYMSDTLLDINAIIAAYRYRMSISQDDMSRLADVLSVPVATPGSALLVLSGDGYGVRSYVESNLAEFKLRNAFDPFNTIVSPANPGRVRWLFNPREVIIDGVTVRTASDDCTPDHIYGTTLGANHGYTTGELTVTGHDKTTADVGSVWATGGVQYTLVGIKDANTLILTRRSDNLAVPSGVFTYVSGGTHITGYTATATVSGQMYPPAQDMKMRVLVDGQQVCAAKNGVLLTGSYTGSFSYRDSVQFIETYDILSKSELIAFIEANGATGIYPTGKSAAIRVTNVYEYDRYAQSTVLRDWLFLQAVDVQDLMGIQLELLSAANPATMSYYVPNTVSFTYNGATVNYALTQRGDLTINAPGQPSVFFNTANIETTGPYLERALGLYDAGYVDAAGFLPIADVKPAGRKALVSTKAMEIRGNTGKRYFRVVDKGSYTTAIGDHYSAVAYRHVFPKSGPRTAFYTVRNREADYIFIDWHNFSGLDTVQVSEEMIGRSFTVYASRNATAKGDVLAGCISASVSATGDYGYLILRVAK